MPLGFRGKLLVDEARGRLVVHDTGHDWIVVADLNRTVRQVIGRDRKASRTGP